MDDLQRHPLSAAWPDFDSEERELLAESFDRHGYLPALGTVHLFEGMVLEGWHTLQECIKREIQPSTETYRGDNPVGFVRAANGARRHVSKDEIARATRRMLNHQAKEVAKAATQTAADPLFKNRTRDNSIQEQGLSKSTKADPKLPHDPRSSRRLKGRPGHPAQGRPRGSQGGSRETRRSAARSEASNDPRTTAGMPDPTARDPRRTRCGKEPSHYAGV